MDHRRIDERSLVFGRAIAAKLIEHPEVHTATARQNIARWLATCSPGVRITLEEWLRALDGPLDGVIALLTGGDARATRLRQSNPFAGVLSEPERIAIIRRFQSYAKSA